MTVFNTSLLQITWGILMLHKSNDEWAHWVGVNVKSQTITVELMSEMSKMQSFWVNCIEQKKLEKAFFPITWHVHSPSFVTGKSLVLCYMEIHSFAKAQYVVLMKEQNTGD